MVYVYTKFMFKSEYKNKVLTVWCIKSAPTLAVVSVDGKDRLLRFKKGVGMAKIQMKDCPKSVHIIGASYIPVK